MVRLFEGVFCLGLLGLVQGEREEFLRRPTTFVLKCWLVVFLHIIYDGIIQGMRHVHGQNMDKSCTWTGHARGDGHDVA